MKPARMTRTKVPAATRRDVLMESGYRCATPTCRTIITLEIHHIVHVAEDGGNETGNLIALCPNCHSLYHKGEIPREAIRNWKALLVALNAAFDRETIDHLHFLDVTKPGYVKFSGDGVLKFARLIASGLADVKIEMQNGPLLLYSVQLTPKGSALLSAWKKGDRNALSAALAS